MCFHLCRINDRLISANGISLENVDYARAVQVLRDSGAAVQLVVKRRIVLPAAPEAQTIKVTLTKNKKKEGKELSMTNQTMGMQSLLLYYYHLSSIFS